MAITNFTEGSRYLPNWVKAPTTTGESAVTGSTFTKFGRLLISTLLPVALLTMLSTITNGQAIDKDASVKPQVKDSSIRPQANGIFAKPQAANARSLSAARNVSSQTIRTDDTGAVAVEATSGSFRLDTGSQGKRSYHVKTPYGALNVLN